jgi:hypothetical protein
MQAKKNELEINMSQDHGDRYDEAATLYRALEILFRKLSRFLIGRISLVKLQEILRLIYVEEAEAKLRNEYPKKNAALTQLALLTGLDTRTLTKVRNSGEYRQPLDQQRRFLKDATPAASILDEWSSNPAYVESEAKTPKDLPISGTSPSFQSLFQSTVRSRGITYKSLLKQLINSGSILIDEKKQKVSLRQKRYLPKDKDDKLGTMNIGFSAIGNMVDTVCRNISAIEHGGDRFYQRGVWTYRLDHSKRKNLRQDLAELLDSTDAEARKIIEKYEDLSNTEDLITAGISSFYFEEL